MVLLTLAAEDKGVLSGPCLSDEELAVMVEGRDGKNRYPKLWEHLGTCPKCYEAWLFLKKNMQQERSRGRLYRFGKLPKLAYLGTVLAAAASIAVYLNIADMPEKTVEHTVVPQTHISLDKNIAASPPAARVAKEDKDAEVKKLEQVPADLSLLPPAAPMEVGSDAAAKKRRLEAVRESTEKPLEEKQKWSSSVPPEQLARKVQREAAKGAGPPMVDASAHAPGRFAHGGSWRLACAAADRLSGRPIRSPLLARYGKAWRATAGPAGDRGCTAKTDCGCCSGARNNRAGQGAAAVPADTCRTCQKE